MVLSTAILTLSYDDYEYIENVYTFIYPKINTIIDFECTVVKEVKMSTFQKSDMGAQAAWKGFSSQTLYIASRLISDECAYEYYPEDVEDLVIKKNGVVIEAVQVKNISADLTLSSLASTKTSLGGEGFFNRMCSLHKQNSWFRCIKIVYFNTLGPELQKLQMGNANTKKVIMNKLMNEHGLSKENTEWLLSSLHFEKVNLDDLELNIQTQISKYVPVMSAPTLAKDLLIQHISVLSNSKGFITLKMWQEKIHEIGTNIAAIDGFYKEYNKSLVRLDELQLTGNHEQLEKEYLQGVSAHPTHIRNNFDFKRNHWMEEIQTVINNKGVAILKGVSGQGKTTLCYRYLIDRYPEGCVFCVRAIANEGQAQNLVSALDGLGKHNEHLIIYIDVQPGETLWAFLLQELQARGLSIPVLISIRDEDYNRTPISGKAIKHGIVDLTLSKEEAALIYSSFTEAQPHTKHRTFEEAWQSFGGQGPLIEFAYLLTNNQTLAQRLQDQVDALLQDGVSDEWLELLQLVCYVGRLGCTVNLASVKNEIHCSTINSAIKRLKDEYLIRVGDDGSIEALHPVRAKIVFDALCNQIYIKPRDVVFKALSCISSKNVRVVLLDYFSNQRYDIKDVQSLSQISFKDWIGYANAIRSMLWLDVKRYVDNNMTFISSLVAKRGKGWLCFLPIDLSGILQSDKLILDGMKDWSIFNEVDIQNAIDEVKSSLTSLSINYQATDYFINNSAVPSALPNSDTDRSSFGYALFWMAKRNVKIKLPYNTNEIVNDVCAGGLQPSADVIRGLFEHPSLFESYLLALDVFEERLIPEMHVLSFTVTSDKVSCKFIPPLFTETKGLDSTDNTNHYWRMKMLDILKQLYPDKEYIDIELIGVDYLRNLGIEVFDNKLHIHRSNRPNNWVSELNGWTKIRIDYSLRPSSWQEYVSDIDEIRRNANDLLVETIKLIDGVYKKGRTTQNRGKRIDERLKVFREQTFNENRLPYSAVDPYRLYSEGIVKIPGEEYFSMRQLLSVGKYDNFRKALNNVYSSLDNFYKQFLEIIQVRIKKQDIRLVKNPGLAMYNLYSASKALVDFQKEYNLLFSDYSSLDENFSRQELENMLTLVNVCRYVLDNPPKGNAIAYDSKQKYRKGTNYFNDTLSKVVTKLNGTLLKGDKYAYICVDYNMECDNSLVNEYTKIVMTIRDAFKNSILPSSDRWYLETQSLELAYVPVFSGTFSPVVYSIPFFKVLDTKESDIAKSMYPCEIEPLLNEKISATKSQGLWTGAMKKLGEMYIYLQRYQQILQVSVDDKCLSNVTAYTKQLVNQISILWDDFILVESIVNKLIKVADEKNRELLNAMQIFFGWYEQLKIVIDAQNDPSEYIELIDNAFSIMLVLLPFVSEHSS